MKLRTIKWLKYLTYAAAGTAQIATAFLIYSRGDAVKRGFQSVDLFSLDTRIALIWVVCALTAFYAPVLARYFQTLQDRYRLNDKDFLELYRESLSNAINDLEDVRVGEKDYDKVQLGILLTIVNIVRYYLGAGEETKINANLMVPVPPDDPRCTKVKFLEQPGGLTRCAWLLRIDKWALFEPEVPTEFCLPVYDPEGDWKDRILFGGPLAFVTRTPYLVRNTFRLRTHWSSGVSNSVKAELTDYFRKEKKVLRSFASLPATTSPDAFPVAIINIHWNRRKMFGKSSGLVIDLLLPFLLVIAHVRGAAGV
jgi:hypothetical protein